MDEDIELRLYDDEHDHRFKLPPAFRFAHCKESKSEHMYCTGHFTRKTGTTVYCTCECHEPPEREP